MRRTKRNEPSDYTKRGFASLHIKKETHQRLNLVKAQKQTRDNAFISHDDFLNLLLNHFDETVASDTQVESES